MRRRRAAPLVFTRKAEADVAEAFDRYEAERPGRGKRFRAALARKIALIERMPRAFRIIEGTPVRVALVHRFPYSVYYVARATVTRVIAVVHQHREPTTWRRRWT